jgi:hypothetical protein
MPAGEGEAATLTLGVGLELGLELVALEEHPARAKRATDRTTTARTDVCFMLPTLPL